MSSRSLLAGSVIVATIALAGVAASASGEDGYSYLNGAPERPPGAAGRRLADQFLDAKLGLYRIACVATGQGGSGSGGGGSQGGGSGGIVLPPGVKLPPGFKLPKKIKVPKTSASPVRPVAYPAASATARKAAKLARPAGARLRSSRLMRNSARAQRLAGELALGGSPAAALAALLIVIEKLPRDGLAVMNAGVMLLRLGKPAEALAFFDRAAKLGGPDAIGLRVRRKAAVDANRAVAFVALGRNEQALAAARRALSRSPYLVEARETLATALVCEGKTREAKCELAATIRRPLGPDEDRPPCAVAARLESPNDLGDQSRGTPGELPKVEYITFADKGANYNPYYQSLAGKAERAESKAHDVVSAATGPADSSLKRMNPATMRRTSNIVNAIRSVVTQPDIARKRRAALAIDAKTSKIVAESIKGVADILVKCQGDSVCVHTRCGTYVRQQHEVWYRSQTSFDVAQRAWWKEQYRRETALLANIATPVWHRLLAAELEASRMAAYGELLSSPRAWSVALAGWKEMCLDDLPDPAPVAPALAPGKNAGPCPPGLEKLKFEMSLGDGFMRDATKEASPLKGGLSVHCNEAELSIGTDVLPFIGAFGKVKRSFTDGTTTIYVGSKAGALGASFESGVYIKFDSRGSLQDVGWKTGPKGFGKSDIVTMSFLSSAAPASAGALPIFAGGNR